MTKLVLFLFAVVLVLGVARAAARILLKGLTDMFRGAAPAATNRPPVIPRSGSLKKDPVCGTFVDPATALQKTVKGQTYYFCSAACRDKFTG